MKEFQIGDIVEYSTRKFVYFYILIDPRDNTVRYVGQTSDPKARLSAHIRESERVVINYWSKKHTWVNALLKKDMLPVMKIIDIKEITNRSDILSREKELIEAYKAMGHKLTNSEYRGPYGRRIRS